MSYLDGPRLVFSGEFQADVSTVNNDVRHYDNATFEARFQQFSQGAVENGWWNPIGGGAFRLLNCRVRAAVAPDGTAVAEDAVLGAAIGGSTDRVAAKIVDLDPQWQLSSELWGLRIQIVTRDEVLFGGHFEPAGFRDIWFPQRTGVRRQLTARYTSVLTGVEWTAIGRSQFADALREATAGDLLSVRLVTFAYDTNHLSPRFTIGTLLGAIGPYRLGEPHRFVRGRRFAPKPPTPSGPAPLLNFFDGQVAVDGDAVTVDLGNALPVADRSGKMIDIGEIRLGLLASDDVDEGEVVSEGADYVPLGEPVAYRSPRWLLETAGVVRATVPKAARAQLSNHPIAVIGPGLGGGGEKVLIRETPQGWHVRVDGDLHRVDAGGTVTASIHVSRFGAPVPDAAVTVRLQPPQQGVGGGSPNAPEQPQAPIPVTGSPPTAVELSQPPLTDETGRTTCTIACSNPDNPRGYLDGQLYQFRVAAPGVANPRENRLDAISVVVYDACEVPDRPTWQEHVAPVLTQYGNLYPVMSQRLVDLGDYESVRENRQLLRFAFALDITNPNHMPVTRDLSGPKRTMILRWLDSPDLARGEEGPPARTRSLRAAAPPVPTRPTSESPSVQPKVEFLRGYLGLPATPADPDTGAEA